MKNDENFRMHIMEMEKEEKHAHREIEINYILTGSVELILTGETFRMRKNDIILINSNKLHWWQKARECVSCRIFISDIMLKETLGRYSVNFWCNSVTNSVHDTDRLRVIMNSLIKRYRSAGKYSSFALECSKYLLLDCLAENFLIIEDQNQAQVEDQRIGRIVDYINHHFSKKTSLGSIAEMMYLSESYLSRLFKSKTGMNFREYVSRLKLNYAVDNLLYTDKSITQIAQESGFENASAFNKLFKKNYDCSPSEYKKYFQKKIYRYEEHSEKLSQILDHWIEEETGKEEENIPGGQALTITVPNKPGRMVRNNTIRCINFGTAWDLIQASLQNQLLHIHSSLQFEYVRIENIFSRDFYMRIGRGSNKYTFAIVDTILDFIVDNGMIPVIDLTVRFKHAYADVGEELFSETKDRPPFQDLTDWKVLLENFMDHLVRRYGVEHLEKWVFELDESEQYREICERTGISCIPYRQLWRMAGRVLKDFVPEATFGGEISILTDQEIIPDFITHKIYPYSRHVYGKDVYSSRITDMEFIEHDIKKIRKELVRQGYPDMKLIITEWSTAISERNAYNDSCGKAAHVLKHLITLEGENCILCYQHGSDFLSQYLDTTSPFPGGNGLVTKDGICKPVFYAFQFMNQIRGKILVKGENHLITCNREKEFFILLLNPKKFSHVYYLSKESEITYEKLADIYEDEYSLNIQIEMKNIRGSSYEMKCWSMTEEEGSVLYQWKQMGQPEMLSGGDVKYLKNLCIPRMKTGYGEIKNKEVLLDMILKPNQISFIWIRIEE